MKAGALPPLLELPLNRRASKMVGRHEKDGGGQNWMGRGN